jgi:hypothetical protein
VTLPWERIDNGRKHDDNTIISQASGINALNASIESILNNRMLPLRSMEHMLPPALLSLAGSALDIVSHSHSAEKQVLLDFRHKYPQLYELSVRLTPSLLVLDGATTTLTHSLVQDANHVAGCNAFDATLYRNKTGREGRQNLYLYQFPKKFDYYIDFQHAASIWASQLQAPLMLDLYRTDPYWFFSFSSLSIPESTTILPPIQVFFNSIFQSYQQGLTTTAYRQPITVRPHFPRVMQDTINLLRYKPEAVEAVSAYDDQTFYNTFAPSLMNQLNAGYITTSTQNFITYAQAMQSQYDSGRSAFGVFSSEGARLMDLELEKAIHLNISAFRQSNIPHELSFYSSLLSGGKTTIPLHSQCPPVMKTIQPLVTELYRRQFETNIVARALTNMNVSAPILDFASHQFDTTKLLSPAARYDSLNALQRFTHHAAQHHRGLPIFPVLNAWYEKFIDKNADQYVVKAIYHISPNLFWDNLASCLMDQLPSTYSEANNQRIMGLLHVANTLLGISDTEMAQFFDCYYLWVFHASTLNNGAFMALAKALSITYPEWAQYSFVYTYKVWLQLDE